MIVYRLQSFPGSPDWANEWHPTKEAGEAALKAATAAELPARLDKIDVPSGREALCEFLNLAGANHMNQNGELIARNY